MNAKVSFIVLCSIINCFNTSTLHLCIFMWEIHNFCCVPFQVVDGVDPAAALWLEAENQKSGVY